jgi:acyl carrier protein
MNQEQIERKVLEIFLGIAPDVDPATLDHNVPLRQQFDFDSMDTLNFAIGLHQAFGIEIPETQYGRLATLAGASAYVAGKLAQRRARG